GEGRAVEVHVNQIAVRRDQHPGDFVAQVEELPAAFSIRERDRNGLVPDMQHKAAVAPRQPGFMFNIGNNESVLHQETANAGEAGTAHAARYSAASRSTSSPMLGTSWMVAMPWPALQISRQVRASESASPLMSEDFLGSVLGSMP